MPQNHLIGGQEVGLLIHQLLSPVDQRCSCGQLNPPFPRITLAYPQAERRATALDLGSCQYIRSCLPQLQVNSGRQKGYGAKHQEGLRSVTSSESYRDFLAQVILPTVSHLAFSLYTCTHETTAWGSDFNCFKVKLSIRVVKNGPSGKPKFKPRFERQQRQCS